MSVETPIVRVFRAETWLPVYRSVAVGWGAQLARICEKMHFKKKICFKYNTTLGVRLQKVEIYVLIFNSRKYEVVVVGQK